MGLQNTCAAGSFGAGAGGGWLRSASQGESAAWPVTESFSAFRRFLSPSMIFEIFSEYWAFDTKWGSLFDLSKLTSIRLGIGRSRWGHGRCGGGVRAGAQALRRQEDKALHPSPHTAEALVPSWQESRRMYSLFRRMREISPLPGNVCPKCMLFEIKMATSSSYASISGRNRAIQDTWRANLAAKGPFSRRGTRNHAWREDVASAARPFRGSGPHSLAERALRPVVHAWLACRMCGPPAIGAHKMRGSPNRT